MSKYFLIFVLIVSNLISQDSLSDNSFDINYYVDDRIDASLLHLDYNDSYKSSFLLDKYYPNHFSDHGFYSLKISGSMNEPIYQMISEKIFFDLKEPGKISQLSYKEKKAFDYFDTKIALKVDMNNKLRFLGFLESKSFTENINQNYLLNINKIQDNGVLDISYSYHIDDAPIEYLNENIDSGCQAQNYHGLYYLGDNTSLNCQYSTFNKTNESYLFGFTYKHSYNKVNLSHSSSYQVSTISKDFLVLEDLNYNNKYVWHQDDFSYKLSSRSLIFLKQNYKSTIIEDYESNDMIDSYQNMISIGSKYKFSEECSFSFRYDLLGSSVISSDDYEKLFGFSIDFNKPLYKIELGIDNRILSNFYTDDEFSNLFYSYNSKQYLSFEFEFEILKSDLELGEVQINYFDHSPSFFDDIDTFKYNYLLFDSKMKVSLFDLDFSYRFYDTDYTYINEYATLSLSYSPLIEKVRYRPYGKISFNTLVINSRYNIDLESSNLFNYNFNNILNSDKRVYAFNAELGLLFNSFKITYEIMNPFKERYNNEVQYSSNILPQLGNYSKFNIIWIFKD